MSDDIFTRRRIWYAMDARFANDSKIDHLRRRFNASGISVPVVLLGCAKQHDDAGLFRVGWLPLAELAGVKNVERVKNVVTEMQAVALIEVLLDTTLELGGRWIGWETWQRTGRAAMRKAEQRAAEGG